MAAGTAMTIPRPPTWQEAPCISCMPFATTRAASTVATTQPCAGARLGGTSTTTLGENSLLSDPCPAPTAALTPVPNTKPQEGRVPGGGRCEAGGLLGVVTTDPRPLPPS